MGVYIAPDIFWEQISALMDDLEFVRVYPNNLIIMTSCTFEEYLVKVKEVLKR